MCHVIRFNHLVGIAIVEIWGGWECTYFLLSRVPSGVRNGSTWIARNIRDYISPLNCICSELSAICFISSWELGSIRYPGCVSVVINYCLFPSFSWSPSGSFAMFGDPILELIWEPLFRHASYVAIPPQAHFSNMIWYRNHASSSSF